jgi:hypothetical protein
MIYFVLYLQIVSIIAMSVVHLDRSIVREQLAEETDQELSDNSEMVIGICKLPEIL